MHDLRCFRDFVFTLITLSVIVKGNHLFLIEYNILKD